MSFEDHFSGHAALYAACRPRYPEALFRWLAQVAPHRELAWDCATGNGQAAVGLSPYFRRVHASDASEKQLAQAEPRPNIRYACEPAEASGLPDSSAALVTAAQALHWFAGDRFYSEVHRVLEPGGMLVAWCYERVEAEEDLTEAIDHLYGHVLGPCWPPERRFVEDGYRTLPWPYADLAVPEFELVVDWPLEGLLGYLRSWSASQRYLAERGEDAVALVARELERRWGDPLQSRRLRWPLSVRAGRKPG